MSLRSRPADSAALDGAVELDQSRDRQTRRERARRAVSPHSLRGPLCRAGRGHAHDPRLPRAGRRSPVRRGRVRPPPSLGRWRSEEPSTAAELERVGGEALAALGYDLSKRSAAAPRRTARPAVAKRGVFVLGMHRSGTSAATRLINLLGIETCVASDLLPWARDNPRGHWESRSLNDFNDRILARLGCDWTCPVPLGRLGGRSGSRSPEGRGACRLRAGLPDEPMGLEGPRNCLTFRFWARCLDVEPVVVLVHRNPLETTASLAARRASRNPSRSPSGSGTSARAWTRSRPGASSSPTTQTWSRILWSGPRAFASSSPLRAS